MVLFKTEEDALEYIKEHVPLQEEEKEVDIARLKKRFFEIPEEITPGHYEFKSKYGIKISITLVNSDNLFDICYPIFNGVKDVKGEYRPIYSINDLSIQTKHFNYNITKHFARPWASWVIWLPNLRSVESELSHSFVDIGNRRMYLIEEDGWFSRPIDLLGYFHELGHVETRSPGQINKENLTITTSISSEGVKTEPIKKAAYELQREYDANDWLLSNTRKLFKDLGIPGALEAYNYLQVKSYHAKLRRRYLTTIL